MEDAAGGEVVVGELKDMVAGAVEDMAVRAAEGAVARVVKDTAAVMGAAGAEAMAGEVEDAMVGAFVEDTTGVVGTGVVGTGVVGASGTASGTITCGNAEASGTSWARAAPQPMARSAQQTSSVADRTSLRSLPSWPSF